MSPTTVDRLIAILTRARMDAEQAGDSAGLTSGRDDAMSYARDAFEEIGEALDILRAEQADTERDLNVQAARQ